MDESDLMSRCDGQLEDWFLQQGMVYGRIFADRKCRFPDGFFLHTSEVLEASDKPLKEGSIIETRNSVYLLGKPHKLAGGGDNNDTNILSEDNQDN